MRVGEEFRGQARGDKPFPWNVVVGVCLMGTSLAVAMDPDYPITRGVPREVSAKSDRQLQPIGQTPVGVIAVPQMGPDAPHEPLTFRWSFPADLGLADLEEGPQGLDAALPAGWTVTVSDASFRPLVSWTVPFSERELSRRLPVGLLTDGGRADGEDGLGMHWHVESSKSEGPQEAGFSSSGSVENEAQLRSAPLGFRLEAGAQKRVHETVPGRIPR